MLDYLSVEAHIGSLNAEISEVRCLDSQKIHHPNNLVFVEVEKPCEKTECKVT